eukprot:CCRYP_001203-RA/>CCRYP_001203-RA protein AED:0.57 eAED:0.82 QI:0/0/0/1/0/0/2/0/153
MTAIRHGILAFLSSPSDLAQGRMQTSTTCVQGSTSYYWETITSYKKLIACPLLRDVWTTAFGKEFGNLAQGDRKTGERDEHIVCHDTFASTGHTMRPYCHLRAHDPNRCVSPLAAIKSSYPGELTTRTADLTTSQILWNSVLSTKVQSSWAWT